MCYNCFVDEDFIRQWLKGYQDFLNSLTPEQMEEWDKYDAAQYIANWLDWQVFGYKFVELKEE